MAAITRYTRRVWKSFIDNGGHETVVCRNLKLDGIAPGRVKASLKIEDHNLNRGRVLHGGVILSLTDTMGSLAISTKGQWRTGVSTDINATFVKPAGALGDTVFMETIVVGFGKNMAYTRTEFRNGKGDLVAYGGHSKFLGKTFDDPKNVKFSDDGESIIEGEDIKDDID